MRQTILLALMLLAAFCDHYELSVHAPNQTKAETPRQIDLQQNWHGLTPLHSTRTEVEKLLGSPIDSDKTLFIYKLQQDQIHVWYSSGPCDVGSGNWKVDKDVVILLRIFPRNLELADIKFDQSAYTRMKLFHPSNWVRYINRSAGISINTIELAPDFEEVQSIDYRAKESDQALQCKP
jgi:hypothetical protein